MHHNFMSVSHRTCSFHQNVQKLVLLVTQETGKFEQCNHIFVVKHLVGPVESSVCRVHHNYFTENYKIYEYKH